MAKYKYVLDLFQSHVTLCNFLNEKGIDKDMIVSIGEENDYICMIYAKNTDEKQVDSDKVFSEFLRGELILHIKNEKAYANLFRKLDEKNIDPNHRGITKNDQYDPRFPYFFIENVEDVFINGCLDVDTIRCSYGIKKEDDSAELWY